MIVGVVPAAGSAKRLQPLPVSKEVLEVRGRPVMDYVVERMRAAGADEIRVVTRPEKADVAAHARRSGLAVVEARPPTLSASLRAGLDGLGDDDDVLVGLPDTIWEPLDGFATLLGVLDEDVALALGLFRTGDLERSDVVVVDSSGGVTAVDVKPKRPRSDWIWGCAAARARVLWDVETHAEPGSFFASVARRERVVGVRLSDTWLDIGTTDALARAGG